MQAFEELIEDGRSVCVCPISFFFFFAFQINSKKKLWHKFDNLYNTHTQYYDFKWREWYKYPYFGILEPLEKLVLVTWKKLGNTVIFLWRFIICCCTYYFYCFTCLAFASAKIPCPMFSLNHHSDSLSLSFFKNFF